MSDATTDWEVVVCKPLSATTACFRAALLSLLLFDDARLGTAGGAGEPGTAFGNAAVALAAGALLVHPIWHEGKTKEAADFGQIHLLCIIAALVGSEGNGELSATGAQVALRTSPWVPLQALHAHYSDVCGAPRIRLQSVSLKHTAEREVRGAHSRRLFHVESEGVR